MPCSCAGDDTAGQRQRATAQLAGQDDDLLFQVEQLLAARRRESCRCRRPGPAPGCAAISPAKPGQQVGQLGPAGCARALPVWPRRGGGPASSACCLDLGPAPAQGGHQHRLDDQQDVLLAGVVRAQLRRAWTGSRLRSKSVPRIDGSMLDQSRSLTRARMSSPSLSRSSTASSSNSPPSKCGDLVGAKPAAAGHGLRRAAAAGRRTPAAGCARCATRWVNRPLGSRPMSSANRQNRSRIRKWALRCGVCADACAADRPGARTRAAAFR